MNKQNNLKEVNSLIFQGTNNAVKCYHSPAEHKSHRAIKYILAEFCYENKLNFSSECKFKDCRRADFIIKDWGIIFEILNSEDEKDLMKKIYPLPIIPIKTGIDLKELYGMLEELRDSNGSVYEYYQRKYLDKIFFGVENVNR